MKYELIYEHHGKQLSFHVFAPNKDIALDYFTDKYPHTKIIDLADVLHTEPEQPTLIVPKEFEHQYKMKPHKYTIDYAYTIEVMGRFGELHTLHRIKALTDFTTINGTQVREGDLGGWVETKDNLSQQGNCWIADDAQVVGGASVTKNALVRENAKVFEMSTITDSAIIEGSAEVCVAHIGGSRWIDGEIIYDYTCENIESENVRNHNFKINNSKYDLLEEFMTSVRLYGEEHILHRIVAKKDFTTVNGMEVKVGDIGGWVESEANLSQEGNCWITDNAKVYGKAKVKDDALIIQNAKLHGRAIVSGEATVGGNATVTDKAQVHGRAKVFGNAYVKGCEAVGENTKLGYKEHDEVSQTNPQSQTAAVQRKPIKH